MNREDVCYPVWDQSSMERRCAGDRAELGQTRLPGQFLSRPKKRRRWQWVIKLCKQFEKLCPIDGTRHKIILISDILLYIIEKGLVAPKCVWEMLLYCFILIYVYWLWHFTRSVPFFPLFCILNLTTSLTIFVLYYFLALLRRVCIYI